MKAVIFLRVEDARLFATEIDKALGYPRKGINVGSGPHVPSEKSTVVRWDLPLKHPTKAEWAYPTDLIRGLNIPLITTAINLTADWFSAP